MKNFLNNSEEYFGDFEIEPGLSPMYERIGKKRAVLLGEASHGTHEYYVWRAEISKHLIEKKDFSFIAVEGDWPDCYNLNKYIKGKSEFTDAREIMRGFERWPTWMWANEEVLDFIEWLKEHNKDLPENRKVGFYGLDVYSLWESLRALILYLEKTGSPALEGAYSAYRCFEPFREDISGYGFGTPMVDSSCEKEVRTLLLEMIRSRESGSEEEFNAEQNAYVIEGAENYYRTMVAGDRSSWNVRDEHMMETFVRLMDFYSGRLDREAKGIVWAHNTHIGDASATDMAAAGLTNIGELARKEYGTDETFLVGFGSYEGSVIAGQYWDAVLEEMEVPSARENSVEDIFHREGEGENILYLPSERGNNTFERPLGHRAIGVVYDPRHEAGNYVPTILSDRYDAFIFLDKTKALTPIEAGFRADETPETFPSGV